MSDTSDTSKKPKPIFNPDDVVEPAEPAVDFGAPAEKPADPAPADVAGEEPKAEEKPKPARKPKAEKTEAPAEGAATGSTTETSTESPASDFAGREVVYVQAPIPPKLKGNRGVGTLLAVVGTAVFAALYAGIAFLLIATVLAGSGASFSQFLTTSVFLVPVSIFLVAFILLVLVLNRAGWAAHVFGSLIVGLAVYLGTAGIALLLYTIGGADGAPTFTALLANPFIIIAALLAREVSIWVGLAIAARGRRVKARNLELVDEWEQEHAETKAQYERAGTSTPA